jgi:peptidoglycan/LPS O-acetylase OafA/YrhL
MVSTVNMAIAANSHYRPDIDGLRAVAVGAVIMNHFNHDSLPSGYLGVDIFFVISGFVITASLLNRPSQNLGSMLSSFYSRRVKRLIPALVVFVGVISILICLFNPEPSDSLRTGLAALFGTSNLYLHEQATNYFAASTQLNAFTHTWSLGVEEQFYILFPLLFWYSYSKRSLRPLLKALAIGAGILSVDLLASKLYSGHYFSLFPGEFNGLRLTALSLSPALLVPLVALISRYKSGPKLFAIVLSLLSLASLIYFEVIYTKSQASAYFLMPPRFWELGIGCLLALGFHTDNPWLARLRQVPSLMVAIALCLSLLLPIHFGRMATVLVVFLTALLIASLRPGSAVYGLLTQKKIVKIGLVSYSLYLWHWGVLAISRWTIGIHAWTIPLQLLLMIVLALASYHWIETPVRRAQWSPKHWQTILKGLAILIGGASLVSFLQVKGEELSLDRRFPSNWSKSYLGAKNQFLQQSQLRNSVDTQAMIQTLTHDRNEKELPRPRLYVFGDSHSNHYVEALKLALPEYGVGSASVGWKCGYISAKDITSQTKQWMADCENYAPFVDQFLATNLRPGDKVMIGHRWKEKKNYAHTEETLRHLADLVASKGAWLLLIDDVPEIEGADPLLCEKRPWRPFPSQGCYKTRQAVDLDQQPLDSLMTQVASGSPHVKYIPLRQLYCNEKQCGPYNGKLLIYRDTDHLSADASQLGANRLAQIIRTLPSSR